MSWRLQDEYAPTEDGRNRRLRHRVARRLVEHPVLYIDELAPDERDYYVSSQRPHLDGRVEAWCGLQAERRAEGTAMVDPATSAARALTDLRFPYNIADRQVALLLCPVFDGAHRQGRPLLERDALLRAVKDIVSRFSALERLRDQESVALTLGRGAIGARAHEPDPRAGRALGIVAGASPIRQRGCSRPRRLEQLTGLRARRCQSCRPLHPPRASNRSALGS